MLNSSVTCQLIKFIVDTGVDGYPLPREDEKDAMTRIVHYQ